MIKLNQSSTHPTLEIFFGQKIGNIRFPVTFSARAAGNCPAGLTLPQLAAIVTRF